jgi:transcriptional regulator with XRE-family HTH domain
MADHRDEDSRISPRSRAGIGLRIQQVRRELGLTQAQLADELAKRTRTRANKNQVSQWETQRAPGPQDATLKAIASILGVSAVWLATGEGARDGDGGGSEEERMERAVRIACWAVDLKKVGPPGLAAAISEVRAALREEPLASDRVLSRIARLASEGGG